MPIAWRREWGAVGERSEPTDKAASPIKSPEWGDSARTSQPGVLLVELDAVGLKQRPEFLPEIRLAVMAVAATPSGLSPGRAGFRGLAALTHGYMRLPPPGARDC